jgi:hypothetical protein
LHRHLAWASATLALIITGCGTTSQPTSSTSPGTTACVNSQAAHRAYLVVQHLSGASVQKCVGFAGPTIDGQTLLKQSGIEFQSQTTSFGPAVCQIDSEPAQFSECFPKGKPYWALWTAAPTWAYAQVGFTEVKLHDREAMGWKYVSADDKSPSPPPSPEIR